MVFREGYATCFIGVRLLDFANVNSQVHNFQKLKKISLKAVNFLATNTKVTCLSESVHIGRVV